jgi:hypothetical protein
VELHDKVIGHYLNINTISKLESLPAIPMKNSRKKIWLTHSKKALRGFFEPVCEHIYHNILTRTAPEPQGVSDG